MSFFKNRKRSAARQAAKKPIHPRYIKDKKGVLYHRKEDGTYQNDDGGLLDFLILNAILEGQDSTHGYTASPEFTPGGGTFGGAGAQFGWDEPSPAKEPSAPEPEVASEQSAPEPSTPEPSAPEPSASSESSSPDSGGGGDPGGGGGGGEGG